MRRTLLIAALCLCSFDSLAQDSDADTVPDSTDNCVLYPNPLQLDPDMDGYGNSCDGDFDQDNDVDQDDFAYFSPQLGPPCDLPVCDLCEDGNPPGFCDFGAFADLFGAPPGPSGYACAGTVPCPGGMGDVPSLSSIGLWGLAATLAALAGLSLMGTHRRM